MENEKKTENSKRIQTSLLNAAEKKALVWLAERQPKWVDSDMLTYVGHVGAGLIALGFILSGLSVHFLWVSILGFVVNWYGDSLDGTLARVRNQQRPIYGFYLDHTMDAINEALMFMGAGLSPFMRIICILACLILIGVKSLRTFALQIPWMGGMFEMHILDVIGFVILLALIVIYFVTIFQDARYYSKIDPKHKND